MKQKFPEKIKIIKASHKTYWYSDLRDNCIGKVFNVTGIWNKNYLVDYKDKIDLYMIAFGDCEII